MNLGRRTTAIWRKFAIAASSFAFSGCAIWSFTFDDLPPAPAISPRPVGTLHLEVTQAERLELFPGMWSEGAFVLPEGAVVDQIKQSGRFTSVTMREEAADFSARLLLSRVQGALQPSFAMLTAFVVPAKHDDSILVQLSLRRGDGPVRTCSRRSEFRVWREILLLPLVFTHLSYAYEWRLVDRHLLDCVNELTADLPAASPTPAASPLPNQL